MAERDPTHHSESGSDNAEQTRFPEQKPEHLPPGHPQGSQRAQELPTLNQRESHGVVDEKDPDQQGEQTERSQVQAKRSGESVESLNSRRRVDQLLACRPPDRLPRSRPTNLTLRSAPSITSEMVSPS